VTDDKFFYIHIVCVDSKRFQSLTGQESLGFCLAAANTNTNSSSSVTTQPPQSAATASSPPSVTIADLDALKHEILTEVHREIVQAKQEIIEGLFDLSAFFSCCL